MRNKKKVRKIGKISKKKKQRYTKIYRFCWMFGILWHIKPCGLFNANSYVNSLLVTLFLNEVNIRLHTVKLFQVFLSNTYNSI